MSDLVLKSPLFTSLNFSYSQDSVIRFVGKRNIPFFDCHQVSEETLIKLINYTIEHSDEPFHISYYTYKAGVTLFITHDKLVSKPFWFNQIEYTELFRASEKTCYLSLPLTEKLVKQIDKASKTMKIKKAHLIALATLTEFSPNPWSGDNTVPFNSLIDCALNLQPFNYEKPEFDCSHERKRLSWEEIAAGLKRITGKDSCDEKKINAFIIKARKVFADYKTTLKDENKYNELRYTISAYLANGQLVHEDKVPIQFSLRNLDALFAQNLEYYKHVLYLEVHDPFEDESFIYYPTLTTIMDNDHPQSISFSIPASFFYWLITICGASLRSRNSTLRQAVHNFISNWKEQWDSIPVAQKNAVIEAFSNFRKIAQDHDDDVEEEVEVIKKPRGRPRKNPIDSEANDGKTKRPRGRPSKKENAPKASTKGKK